ncbi:hypothetical protein KCP75_01995 [Salmonella enterica subsp. enterica]|nr:hypothetical protein KCP75_01995 [Salmonella enterica subsp. enterica]
MADILFYWLDELKRGINMSNETRTSEQTFFLKGIVALGAVARLYPEDYSPPDARLRSRLFTLTLKRTKFIVTRVRVTAMTPVASKTWVKDGVITFVESAPESTFTHGTPCVKGLSYIRAGFIAPS